MSMYKDEMMKRRDEHDRSNEMKRWNKAERWSRKMKHKVKTNL